MSRQARSAISLAQSSFPGPSSLPPLLRRCPHSQPLSTSMHRRAASSWLGSIGNYLPFRQRDRQRAERAKLNDPQPADQPEPVPNPNATEETGGIFDQVARAEVQRNKRRFTEHRVKSGQHKISPRKLNDLSRQIAGLPVDEAIVQMQFSEKRASRWIKSTLTIAREHAVEYKGLNKDRLVVSESWVSKGPFGPKRVDIKGRGRRGIKRHPYATLNVLLKEGQTKERKVEIKFNKELGMVRSAGMVREDGKLRRKVISDWAW